VTEGFLGSREFTTTADEDGLGFGVREESGVNEGLVVDVLVEDSRLLTVICGNETKKYI